MEGWKLEWIEGQDFRDGRIGRRKNGGTWS